MSGQIQISSREELLKMMDKGPKTTTKKECPKCRQPIYRVYIKGVEKWMGCACATGRAHHRV